MQGRCAEQTCPAITITLTAFWPSVDNIDDDENSVDDIDDDENSVDNIDDDENSVDDIDDDYAC